MNYIHHCSMSAVFQVNSVAALNPFLTMVKVLTSWTSLHRIGAVGIAVAPERRATLQRIVGILTQTISTVLCVTESLHVGQWLRCRGCWVSGRRTEGRARSLTSLSCLVEVLSSWTSKVLGGTGGGIAGTQVTAAESTCVVTSYLVIAES